MPTFDPRDLADWAGADWVGEAPSTVDGVFHDTREIRPGCIYIALNGENFDGHDFVDEAFKKGAGAALVCRSALDAKQAAGCWSGHPLLVADDSGRALCSMAAGYRISVAPTVVGVTGSVGKSTVKEILTQTLSPGFETAGTIGNWNNDIGLPLSMLAMPDTTEIGVFEVGMNHPGELRPLCDVMRPDWGVVTNVGPVHIGYFESELAIADCRMLYFSERSDNGW